MYKLLAQYISKIENCLENKACAECNIIKCFPAVYKETIPANRYQEKPIALTFTLIVYRM